MNRLIKFLFMPLVAILFPGMAAMGSSTTYYYSTVTAKATGEGKVYVSESSTAPAESDYAAEKSLSIKSENSTSDVYLYAQAPEGQMLKYWEDESGNKVTATKVTVTGSTTESTPTAVTYTAIFGIPGAITVAANDPALGTAAIDNLDNAIGDQVTVTATLAEPWAGGMGSKKYSKSHSFEGWYDENGVLVSKDAKYTFTVTEPKQLTARFGWRQFVTGPGYYRVRWSYAQQFWVLRGSYDPTPSFFSTHESRKLDGVLDLSVANDFADPASIMKLDADSFSPLDSYEEEAVVANGLSLEAQGVSTGTVLSGKTLKLQTCHNVGFYKLMYSSYQIAASEHAYSATNLGYLYVNSDQTGKSGSDPDSYFEFEPLSEEYIDEFYFGPEPGSDMEYDGGYWTSMYTAFPYQCRDGVEAYYISELYEGDETVAVLTQIEDGIVPAYTAVLLKCPGLTSRENRLLPLMEDYPAIEGNLLHGEFQLKPSKNSDDKTLFDSTTMRVLSTGTAGVGFYRLEDGEPLLANRAWLDVSSLANGAARIVIRKDYAGVENVAVDADQDADAPIYDLQGRRVANPVAGRIYIRNGKKYLAR